MIWHCATCRERNWRHVEACAACGCPAPPPPPEPKGNTNVMTPKRETLPPDRPHPWPRRFFDPSYEPKPDPTLNDY